MSFLGALTLVSGVQGGTEHPLSGSKGTLLIVTMIVVLGAICVAIGLYLRRRLRRQPPVEDEWRALAVMGELCPGGWQAQVTLYGWGAPVPDDAPASRVPQVQLEWMEFEEGTERLLVCRRVWAPTIGKALQAMVDDKRADLALGDIERALEDDVDGWWEESA
jgi:hypothetical protein